MSSTPSPQPGYSNPDRRRVDPRAYEDQQYRQFPMTYIQQASPHYEPRHILPTRTRDEFSTSFGRSALQAPPSPFGHSTDSRYNLESDMNYMNYHTELQNLPLRMHHTHGSDPRSSSSRRGDNSSPMLSHGPEYVTHRVRTFDLESQYSSSPAVTSSTAYPERSPVSFASISNTSSTQKQNQPRTQNYRIPHGFDNILHHEPESFPSPEPQSSSSSPESSPPPPPIPSKERFHLHVRQQPIGARACGSGDRDRRPVDPPPIVQILLTDYNPRSNDDIEVLRDPRFTVGCLLFPIPDTPSSWDRPPKLEQTARDEQERLERKDTKEKESSKYDNSLAPLLSGKAFMSPFYVDADPDPNSAPSHPSSSDAPSSPPVPAHLRNASKLNQPATFFIFADLSVRSAGLYRLQFRLMNWGAVEDTGMSMPILAEAWSEPFRVYNAKDFPGMQDSSLLAEGLKELGFMELKTRGKDKGKGRKKP